MGVESHTIFATSLPDAWFQAVDRVLNNGRVWTVQHGSYVGQKRWELDFVTIHVIDPGARPLIPDWPAHMGNVPPPTTMDYIEDDYLPYLMSSRPLEKNEQYIYGSRVEPQMEAVIKRYRKHGWGSNQECIAVAQPDDINLDDPPCLRSIDTRIFALDCLHRDEEPALHFFPYFRSNDLWGGFPANMAALRLMQEYMADSIGVAAGEIVYTSKGLHIYEHAVYAAKRRTRTP